jgi:hypothetical protein
MWNRRSKPDPTSSPERPTPMALYNRPQQQPVRRDLGDARSCAGPSFSGVRKAILNDARSTRSRPA